MVRWGQRLQASTHPLSDLPTRDPALFQSGRRLANHSRDIKILLVDEIMKGATGQQEDMFRSVTPPKKIGSKAYEQQVIDLRADLLKAQIDLGKTPRSIIVTIAGVDGAGKGEVIQLLNEWLDPRGLETHSFGTWKTKSHSDPISGVIGAPFHQGDD